ncbi:hypothetical protein GA707_19760 [Nostocoides sp. F2B08]|uniref:type II secretion system F family protein n=1 Tax=Nostocoides sp. F2B08 TaxID=2653936 RepID=UPI001262C6E4|nr:type II secretion system F family protein [Tetrasphaera sp. F2B08]KAB7740056.1 hypothetical protein GA707_19760 [Tetrasphaera sp. F2B08]
MTTTQLALLLGAVTATALVALVAQFIPAQPDLRDVLTRLSPPTRRPTTTADGSSGGTGGPGVEERLGMWAERTLPSRFLGDPPTRDLAVLRMTPAQFYGKKVLYGLLGLTLPALLTGFFTLLGITVPVIIPAAATVGLSVLLFLAPSRDITQRATTARAEFARALSAFIELCALERNGGAGATVALTNAAAVGDSWVFRRISEEVARSRYNGQPPWDALTSLSEELALPDLADVADIMRLAGDESTEVYRQLRARGSSVRTALTTTELAEANLVEERMYLPASFLGMVFLALLMAPPLLRLISDS